MSNPITLVVFPVKDLEQAKIQYTAFLGTEPYADSAYYVGYKVGDIEIGLDPRGEGIVSYIDTKDIEASVKELEAAGAVLHTNAQNVGGGIMVAKLKDADGNILGLRQMPK